MIDSDDAIRDLLAVWERDGVQQVAMDFEGEFNLHCYGEHLCLIQIFDGAGFYLIDTLLADEGASRQKARALGKPFVPFAAKKSDPASGGAVPSIDSTRAVTQAGIKLLLESGSVEKVWFDCASDGELVWKKFGVRLNRVYDLFRAAKVLGLVGPGLAGNLAALTERFVERQPTDAAADPCRERLSKKQLQQTNWMVRPLSSAQLEYALEDVAHLFALRKALDAMARSNRVLPQVQAAMKGLPSLRQEAVAGHTKLPGYKRLKPQQQIFLRHFFEARDTVARQLNKPPFQVLDKHLLVRLAQEAPATKAKLRAELGVKSQAARLLLPLMEAATQAAQDEIAGAGRATV